MKQSEIYRDLDLDTYYGDFRQVGRVILPHRLEHRATNNQMFSRIPAERIELDLEIDNSYFKIR